MSMEESKDSVQAKALADWQIDDDDDYEDDDDVVVGQSFGEAAQKKPEPAQEQEGQDMPSEQKAGGQDQDNVVSNQENNTQEAYGMNNQGRRNSGYKQRNNNNNNDRYKNKREGGYNQYDKRSNRSGGGNRDNRDVKRDFGGEEEGGQGQHYNNRQNRAGGYGGDRDRDQRPKREPRPPQDPINPDSNYRLYYCNDPEFFVKVISQEEPPFEFKIHMFSRAAEDVDQAEGEQEQAPQMRNQDELSMLQELDKYEGQDIRTSVIPWQPREQKRPGKQLEPKDKTRFTFFIAGKDMALTCFKDFQTKFHSRDSRLYAKIFYLKPESLFEKYGDEAADSFYKEEEEQKEERAAQKAVDMKKKEELKQKRDDQLQLKKRLSNDPVTSQERNKIEQDTAIKFAGKGKPVFVNSRPKKVAEEAPKTEVPQSQTQMADGIRSSYIQSHRKVFDTTQRGGDSRGGRGERGGRGGERGGRGGNRGDEGDFRKNQAERTDGEIKGFREKKFEGGRGRGEAFRGGEGRGGRGRGRAQNNREEKPVSEQKEGQVPNEEVKDAYEESSTPKMQRIDSYGVENAPTSKDSQGQASRGGANRRNNRQKRPYQKDTTSQTSVPQSQGEAAESQDQKSEGGQYQIKPKNNRPRRNTEQGGGRGRGQNSRPYMGAGGTGESTEGENSRSDFGRGRGRGDYQHRPQNADREQQSQNTEDDKQKQKVMVYRKVIKNEEVKQEGGKIQVHMAKKNSQGSKYVAPEMKKQVSNVSNASKGSIGNFTNKFGSLF